MGNTCLRVYDWMIIVAEIIMFLACCMFGKSSLTLIDGVCIFFIS